MTALPPSLHRSSIHPSRSHPVSGARFRARDVNVRRDEAAPTSQAGLGMLIAAILGAALITATLVGAVWVRMAEVQAGYAIHSLQRETVKLRQRRSELQVEVAALKRPDRLAKVADEELDLVAPAAHQVRHLSEFGTAAKSPPPAAKSPPPAAKGQVKP